MIMINRKIGEKIKQVISGERRVIIIYGQRQSGKTNLIKYLLSEIKQDFEYFTGNDLYAQNIFSKNELGTGTC